MGYEDKFLGLVPLLWGRWINQLWYKNVSGGIEWCRRRLGNRLTIFATELLACNGSACGGEGAKRNAAGWD